MPSPMMILGVLCAVFFAWGSAATWYAKLMVEEVATLEVAVDTANNETLKQIRINGELRAEVAAEQRALMILNTERRVEDAKHQRELARLREQRTRSDAVAIEQPERYSRAVTNDLRRSMREVCRSGGGTAAECKIKGVQAPAPVTRGPIEPDSSAPPGVGEAVPRPAPDMPPG